jgi:hypothetical protein
MTSRLAIVSLVLASCSGDDGGGTSIDAMTLDSPPGIPDAEDGDAPPPTDCTSDNDRLILSGAWTFNHSSVSLITLDMRVIGVSGNLPAPAFGNYTFTVRDAMADIDALGDHDIVMKNLKYLEQMGSCATPGNCNGFFAKAGTFTVTEVTPRYRATFTLTDLYARMDTSNTEGAPIAGTITGCMSAPRS